MSRGCLFVRLELITLDCLTSGLTSHKSQLTYYLPVVFIKHNSQGGKMGKSHYQFKKREEELAKKKKKEEKRQRKLDKENIKSEENSDQPQNGGESISIGTG